MTQQLWLNMPVKDLEKSKAFFTRLGFTFNTQFGNGPDSANFKVGQTTVMLFSEAMYRNVAGLAASDTKTGSEMLVSFDAESPEDVDSIAKKAEEAGANVFGKPSDIQGWMYGCAFADLDGHRWNVLYMDMSKMPK